MTETLRSHTFAGPSGVLGCGLGILLVSILPR
jgi:hypothetical protein